MNGFIDIYCRIRNTRSHAKYATEPDDGGEKLSLSVVCKDGEAVNNRREVYSFRFNKVFDRSASQQHVFDTITSPLIKNVLDGYNCTVFAYGQTGSGKTYTITGGPDKYEERGLIPRCLTSFFAECEQRADFSLKISYLEIYNQVGYDLLQLSESPQRMEDLSKITLQEENGHFHLKGLSLHTARSPEEALNLLFLGDTNRAIAETPMNDASTRSHCIFTVHVASKSPGGRVMRSKFHLVDLAGSERVYKSQLSGVLLKEAKFINRSLHYLEQVILCLSHRNSHVPYRNSLLTSVLKDSLGGNCRTVMIANVSFERENIFESISTCKFAQRVALIENVPVVNEVEGLETVESLKEEIRGLKAQMGSLGVSRADPERCREVVKLFAGGGIIPPKLVMSGEEVQICLETLRESFSVSADRSYLSNADSLAELVKQRDAEISILVGLLKQGRGGQEGTKEVGREMGREGSREGNPDLSREVTQGQLTKQRKTLMEEMSQGQREIFEEYKKEREGYAQVEEKQGELRDLFRKAKEMGEEIFRWREEIKQLRVEMQQGRGDGRLQEKTLRFNGKLGELKALKAETEHVQFVLEKMQIKLIQNFKSWWNLNHKFYENQRRGEERAGSGDYGDIPLTGDREVDEDIQAFIKARTELLSRQ